MIRLHIVAEGSTEETFVKELLSPPLFERGVLATPILIGKSGGCVAYGRLKKDVTLYLKSDPTSYCTTFIDYYGLGPGFPAKITIGKHDPPAQKKEKLERAVYRDVADTLGKRYDASHFIPYVQMYEFEGLLFSDSARFAAAIGKPELVSAFEAIRAQVPSPEHINDDKTTAPSKRVQGLYAGYTKEFLGNLAALEIGLSTIRAACPLFNGWVERLEALGQKDAV